jgi:hypothetical protein
MKAIGNISDIPVQNRVMTLIRDEKELKQLYSNTSHSFDRTSGVLKSKGFYKDFIEAASKSESLTLPNLSLATPSGMLRGTITLPTI